MTKTVPPPPDPVKAAVKAIIAILASIERSPSPAATIAFQAAVRRHGHNLIDMAGPAALDTVRVRIVSEAPDRAAAQERESVITEAWQGIVPTKGNAA